MQEKSWGSRDVQLRLDRVHICIMALDCPAESSAYVNTLWGNQGAYLNVATAVHRENGMLVTW